MSNKIIVGELGSWHGRSSRAIADNLPEGAVLYCIDTWNGSAAEQDTWHQSAKWADGDHAFYEFLENNGDLVQQGKIIPIRMHSKHAASLFTKLGIRFDFFFIDAEHTYEAVKEDIQLWEPLMKEEGILCGHDYYEENDPNAYWPGVRQAVNEIFGSRGESMQGIEGNSIWAHIMHPEHGFIGISGTFSKPNIYDCFPFNNEIELVHRRMTELNDVVDRFVIVEASKTHAGKPKPYYFKENLGRFAPFLHKITHIMLDDYPEVPEDASITDKSWAIERHQRDAIMRGLTQCMDDDIIIISDADEIPHISVVERFKQLLWPIGALEMDLFYYNESTKAKDPWKEAKIARYSEVKKLGPCGIRYCEVPSIPNSGKHLSYQGGVDRIIQKIEDTAHQEYNKPEFKDRERIQKAIKEGSDLFGRNLKYEKV